MPAPSRPHPLGVHPRGDGVEVAVLAAHAERVQFCLLEAVDGGWSEQRIDLPGHTHGVWHGFVPGVGPGRRYGLRAHGEWNPRAGLRHNPAKLLLDPYARAVDLPDRLHPEVFGHPVGDDLVGNPRVPDHRDSLPFAARGVVVPDPEVRPSTRPGTPWAETVIYEAHVRGLTRRLPGVPDALRGTYAGLAHPATIEHLRSLGVTAVELLPVHASLAEPHLVRRGLPNYWGYSTLGFFAPHPGYASGGGAGEDRALGAVTEFREMVAALHAAGLEVLLDVVYNHTAESGVSGPTLSFRGLDAATYYRLDADGRDIDFTGCGNSLDATHARVVQLVLDSLRYWVEVMDVDGFRFDLAPTLARGRNEFDPDHPMLVAMRADPVLAGVKLIAEPWDVGPDGWRTGQFPVPFAEWNDRFRDDVREFWLPGAARAAAGESTGGLRDLGTRIAGSVDTFAAERGPLASINFVTAHDGLTLADLTAYNGKHNQDNGEDNRDGTDNNRSWNHGTEGPSDDAGLLADRRRSIRNLLATLLFSAGVPMIVAGDEFGRTQNGNNNPYSQDNETSWLDWDLQPWQEDLLATTRHLIALRHRFPALGAERFFTGRHPEGLIGGLKDLTWFAPDGTEMTRRNWEDGGLRMLQVLFATPTPDPAPLPDLAPTPDLTPTPELAPTPDLVPTPYLAPTPDLAPTHDLDPAPPAADAAPGSTPQTPWGSLLVIIAGAAYRTDVVLPIAPSVIGYELLWNSADERPPATASPPAAPQTRVSLPPNSFHLYRALHP
jgi:isoamylase